MFDEAINELPVIAILRGLNPDEAERIAEAILEAGIRAVEVPLNSPEPFKSIAKLAKAFGAVAAIGAGTVLTARCVNKCYNEGAAFTVSPNTDVSVIRASLKSGLTPVPGFSSPSEAFAAFGAGARKLKLFPAGHFGPGYLSALKAVLPDQTSVFAVGGVSVPQLKEWLDADARGFGFGSLLFKPGDGVDAVKLRADDIVRSVKFAMNSSKI